MISRPFCLTVFFVAFFVSAPMAFGQKTIQHDKEKISVTIPKGWQTAPAKHTKRQPLGNGYEGYRVLEFIAALPKSNRAIHFAVDITNNAMLQRRPDVLRLQTTYGSDKDMQSCEVHEKPLLHVVATPKPESKKLMIASAMRRLKGRTLRLVVQCDPKQWGDIKPVFLDIAKTMPCEVPAWPQWPKGRIEKDVGGIRLSSVPEVKKAMRDLQKCVKDVAKEFTSLHGAVSRPKGDPLLVFVNELKADHKRIVPSAEVREVVSEPGYHCLFTVPLDERGERIRSTFVGALTLGMLYEVYGNLDTVWFFEGERQVAIQRDATKKKLPSIAKAVKERAKITMTFEEVTKQKRIATQEFPDECLIYVAMLHAGPKEYRAAYEAFLAELKKTSDIDGATKKHLLVLDQVKMKADAKAFLKKTRAVKVR